MAEPGTEPGTEPHATPPHWLWRDGPIEAREVVVFDIDGVLSDATGRQHFVEADPATGKKDWRGFFDACGDDALLVDVARLLDVVDPELGVVLLTGRPVRVQDRTVAWLEKHDLRWDILIMRNSGDYSTSPEFKRETLHALRARDLDPRLSFEDDLRNLEMFKSEGVPCVYIHSGYYD